MRSFDYLQKLYKSGVAKKEALFVPKQFNAQGRAIVHRLIKNHRSALNSRYFPASLDSNYASIHDYFNALRRRKVSDLVFKSGRTLPLNKIPTSQDAVYRGFGGRNFYSTSESLHDLNPKNVQDYIDKNALFVTPSPALAGRYGDNILVIKDPKLRKFIDATVTGDEAGNYALSERLSGRAKRKYMLDNGISNIIDIPNPEAVLPQSIWQQYLTSPKATVYSPVVSRRFEHLQRGTRHSSDAWDRQRQRLYDILVPRSDQSVWRTRLYYSHPANVNV